MSGQAQHKPYVAQTNPIQTHPASTSRKQIWTGRILSGLVSLFLLMDAVMKLIKPAFVVQATVELGYPQSAIFGIGLVLLLSTVLYLIPRTAIFGAILLTGYLGGAVATHVRVSAPLFNICFPVIFGSLVWISLALRSTRVRQFLTAREP